MYAIYRRELKSYFCGMTGVIFIAFLLLMTGIYMTVYNFGAGYPAFEYTLSGVSFIYLLAVPVLTMRSIAEEKHSRTDQLLYSLPMNISSVVMAKYLAMLTILAVPVGIMLFYPLILCMYGTVSLTAAYSAILAFFLLGAALIAIGMFISSLTESQVIAAVISVAVLLLCYLMSGISTLIPATAAASMAGFLVIAIIIGAIVQLMIKNSVVSVAVTGVLAAGVLGVYLIDSSLFENALPEILASISLFDRMTTFINGMFDLTAVVFYLSVAGLFVFLTVQSLEKKRWNG